MKIDDIKLIDKCLNCKHRVDCPFFFTISDETVHTGLKKSEIEQALPNILKICEFFEKDKKRKDISGLDELQKRVLVMLESHHFRNKHTGIPWKAVKR